MGSVRRPPRPRQRRGDAAVKLPKINIGFWHVAGIFVGAVASVALYKWAFGVALPNVPILSGVADMI